jgi:hypothetical protein
MDRALPSPLEWRPLRWALIALGVVMFLLNLDTLQREVGGLMQERWRHNDWDNFAYLDPHDPYSEPAYVWSPLAAWPLQLMPLIGYPLFTAGKFAALLLVRDWRVIAALLLTWPFWFDVRTGNTVTYVLIAAWLALSGNRWAIYVFYTLTLLIPRMIMLPVAVWLFWKHPETRKVGLVLFAVNAVLLLLSGQVDDWARHLAERSAYEMARDQNWLPSRWIGSAWTIGAVAISAVLLWYGRVGISALAASSYFHGNYVVFLLLELHPSLRRRRRSGG